MQRLRVATLLAGFLAVQLSLVAGGPSCLGATPVDGASALMSTSTVAPVMANMAMAATVADPRAPTPANSPCGEQGAPRACQSLTSCIVSFVGVIASVPGAPVPERDVPTLAVLTPVWFALPPDVPPPRA
ncbi:MAG: hypothetical protein NVS9B3_16590 [Gemmatimonadaceae bacterium]